MRWRGTARTLVPALALTLALAPPHPADGQTATDAPRQLVTVVHVHSSASSGTETPQQLARRARRAGVDAVVLSENFGYEFRYAPALLRRLVEARLSTPGLNAESIDTYLAALDAAERAEPGIVLVPGIEVPPYYRWTGSLLSGDLTLHDMQRNVLIVPAAGASDEEIRQLLHELPVIGNPHHRSYGARSLILVLPGLLLVLLGGFRLTRGPLEPSRSGTWAWIGALLVGAGLLWVNYPYDVPLLEPYTDDAGDDPTQRLFDFVQSRGGLTFWSMPEASDHRQRMVGPVPVRLSTDAHPTVLLQTRGYTGFGGVYADTVAVWAPGGTWDEALAQVQAGRRAAPPWLIGESAYHYAGQAGKQLDDVLTVLRVREPTRTSVFMALAGGHGYAVRRRTGGIDLRLPEFALVAPDDRDVAGASGEAGRGRAAREGEVLQLAGGGSSFDLVVRIEEAGGAEIPIRIEIVRNGSLLRRLETTTPVSERWTESLAPDAPGAYYRLIVSADRPAYLVSNPVFVRRIDDRSGSAAPFPGPQ